MLSRQEQVIESWIGQASAAIDDQREHGRYPFFRPSVVTLAGSGILLPAFSRDISTKGLGLLHRGPLEAQTVQVTIAASDRQQIQADVEIRWSAPLAEGWFLSGGPFTDMSRVKALGLVWAIIKVEVTRRVNQRQPFFRPATVQLLGAHSQTITAFSRDISTTGIGLFHSVPIAPQRVWLRLEPPLDINTIIRWCRPCGEGAYISGGQFSNLALDELPSFRP